MKSYEWFILGLLLLLADIVHGSSTSFTYVHYALIAISVFFIVGAFIIATGKETLADLGQDPLDSHPVAKKSRLKKYLLYLAIFLVLAYIYIQFKHQLVLYAESIPWLWNIVMHIEKQIAGSTLLGLFYAAFFGALFFTPVPVELIFLYYLTLDYNVYVLLLVMLVGGALGEIANYLIGMAFGGNLLKFMIKDKFDDWKAKVDKYGGLIIVAAGSLPLPLGAIALMLGALKYSVTKFVIYVTVGRIIRYVAIIMLQSYITYTVIPFFDAFL